jgi:DNA-binding transcriptional LysR family regulator
MVAVPLGPPQRYALVGVTAYLAQHGKPRHPRDLLDHPCIRVRFSSGAMLDWEFEKAGRVGEVSPPAKLVVESSGPALRAACDGVGFWLTFSDMSRATASGALVSVLDDWCPPFPDRSCITRAAHQPPPALAAFVAFVAEWRKKERRRRATRAPTTHGRSHFDDLRRARDRCSRSRCRPAAAGAHSAR